MRCCTKKRLVPFFLLLVIPPAFGTAADVADPHWTSTGAISYDVGMNILAHPSDPTRLYARSGRPYYWDGYYSGPELFRSTDAGRTFTSPRAPSRENLLLLDPWNPDILWGASYPSLVRSTDGGDTWSPVAINLPSYPLRRVVAILATRPPTLLLTIDRPCLGACSGGGLYRSTNGSDWTLLAFATSHVYEVFTDSKFPRLIYATVDNPPKLLRTTDGGSTWETVFEKSNLPRIVAVDPIDPDTIYGLFNYLYKSSDAGRTWSRISDGLPVNDYYGPTVQACVVDPTNRAHLYVAMNGEVGVHHSTDGGATWTPLVGGAGVRFAQSLAVDPTGHGLYAGTMVRGTGPSSGPSPRAAVIRWTTDAFSRILPSAASIHGVNGAFFHSDVRIFNPSLTSPVDVTARYNCFTGSCDGASRSFTVRPREQMIFDDIVTNFLQAPDSAGPIEFSSALPILVTSRAYTPAKPAPTIGQFVPGLTLDDAVHEAVLTSLSHSADQAGGSRTNIGIVGPFEASQTISIELFDSSARKLGSVSRLLPAQQAIQFNDSDLFLGAGISGDVPDFYAVVRGEGIWPFFAYATVIDNVTQDSIFITGRNP